METTLNYESAVYTAWLSGMAIILGTKKVFRTKWQPEGLEAEPATTVNILWLIASVAGVIGISSLLSYFNNPLRQLIQQADIRFAVQILLVYTPVFIYLYRHKKNLATCYISTKNLPLKIITGFVAAFVSGIVFIKIRSTGSSVTDYLSKTFSYSPVTLFQTFMEGLGVGFILFRLFNWMKPLYAAMLIAAVFMLAHIPSYTEGFHKSWPDAMMLIAAHAGISFFIFYCLQNIRDVISLFFVHWFVNAASAYTSS